MRIRHQSDSSIGGRVRDFQIGEGTHGDRLERGARAIGADFGDRLAEYVGGDRRDHRAADPALARTHPAPGEDLKLVRALSAELRGAADLPDRYFLATAGDDLVFCRDHDRA